MNFFLTELTHTFLRLVPKVMLQKLMKHMLSSILIHKLYVKYLVKFVREPGKHCLPKWYIENINDYITLVLYIGLVLDSKNIQFHIICSFYYTISINSTEVDPHSNSLHYGIVKPIVNMIKTKNLFKAPFINSI